MDYNKFYKNEKTDIVWMIENYFYLYKALDVTDIFLHKLGYYPSFNSPFNEEIYNNSGYRE